MASNKRNHVEEDVPPRPRPRWVSDLTRKHGGSQAFFIAAKRIQNSDLTSQQNRVLLPNYYVKKHLVPALSDAERTDASLVAELGSSGKKKKTMEQPASSSTAAAVDGPEVAEPKKKGRKHGGLVVTAFARNGFRFLPQLTRWDSSQETVLKGDEVKLLTTFSSLTVEEEIEVWGFRLVNGGDLCFAFGKRA